MLLTSAAGFQFVSPAWLAATLTVPAAVNVRFVSSEMSPGPLATANDTGRPESASALKATMFVATWGPGSGKSMLWSAFATISVPVAEPSNRASSTTPVTAYMPALVGAQALPSYVTFTVRPVGTVATVTARAAPLYSWFVAESVTTAVALNTLKVLVSPGAANQLASPSCCAATRTVPAPVKVSFVGSGSSAGPDVTVNSTDSPESAVALSHTMFVATWSEIASKSMLCDALDTTSVAFVCPVWLGSSSVATNA